MSEYNANIRPDDCCGESIHDDDNNDDIFDDLNNIDDSEVTIKLINCFLLIKKK